MQLPKHIQDSILAFRCVTNNNIVYLSNDIILLIYIFVIKDYYGIKINKIIGNYYKTKNAIKTLIQRCLYDRYNTINHDNMFNNEEISALKYLVTVNITRKYNLHLWANILEILSSEINMLRFNHRALNISFKSPIGKKVKLIIDLWLQLCKKFNFKILLQTIKSKTIIRAKYVIKSNNYDQYIRRPGVIQPFSKFNYIINDLDMAKEYLSSRIALM